MSPEVNWTAVLEHLIEMSHDQHHSLGPHSTTRYFSSPHILHQCAQLHSSLLLVNLNAKKPELINIPPRPMTLYLIKLYQQAEPLVQSSNPTWTSSLHNTNHTGPLTEPRPKHAIRILKHAILQTHHNELTPLKPRLDQSPNILCMRQVQRRVHLVQDIHRRGLELKEC